MSKLNVVFFCSIVAMVILLVLLKMDGLSSPIVVGIGTVALGSTAMTFRFALQREEPKSRERKVFEWCAGLSSLALLILHFVLDLPK